MTKNVSSIDATWLHLAIQEQCAIMLLPALLTKLENLLVEGYVLN